LSRERERERERGFGLCHTYNDIISIENLLVSWQEFLRGKRKRSDVAEFLIHFMDNISLLHEILSNKTYRHGGYFAFKINDPKPRDIHKAKVKDRLVHHAIYRILYPYFDQKFIHDSYSCRVDKGTHRAVSRFRDFSYKVSKNNTCTCWVLKCDIRKFFANIDHGILKDILRKNIRDSEIIWLLNQIIDSFHSENGVGKGLPLGNLTSQLLVNVYMNEFDQFVKRVLKVKHYIRYADDFVVLSEDKKYLENIIIEFRNFLIETLSLEIHPAKTSIKTLASGIDFLGYVVFPRHIVLRTNTKKRMFERVEEKNLSSYLGLVKHCDGFKLDKMIRIKVLTKKVFR